MLVICLANGDLQKKLRTLSSCMWQHLKQGNSNKKNKETKEKIKKEKGKNVTRKKEENKELLLSFRMWCRLVC